MGFTSLNHHLDLSWLHEAYLRTRRDGAPGVDGQTAADYEANLLGNLQALLERAKRDQDIDPPVKYLHAKVDATLQGMKDIPIACRMGCSHCCHAWVSATAPEVLTVFQRHGIAAG